MVCFKTSATCSQATGATGHVRLSRQPQPDAQALATLPILVGHLLNFQASPIALPVSMITGGSTLAATVASSHTTASSTAFTTASLSLEVRGTNRHALHSLFLPPVQTTTSMSRFQPPTSSILLWSS